MSIYHKHYIYPVVFEKDEDNNIGMYFPDFEGAVVIPENISDGIKRAKELIAFRIVELIEDIKEIPVPSSPDSVILKKNEQLIYVDIYIPPYLHESANRAVTKNCTLPRWLRDAGEEAGLNFSHLLQKAIKDALDIKEYRK